MSSASPTETTDVLICGCGPTGAMLSVLLGQHAVQNVVLERENEVNTDPRGIALDEDGIRCLQACGIYDKVFTSIGQCMGTFMFVGGEHSELQTKPFMVMDYNTTEGGTGHPGFLCHKQPAVEKHLRARIGALSSSDLRLGCVVTAISEDTDWAYITYTDAAGRERHIRSKFLVGADGKTGFTRKKYLEPQGVHMERVTQSSYDETWVALNWKMTLPTPETHPDFPLWANGYTPQQVYDAYFPTDFRFLCNPKRAAVCGRFGLPSDRLWRLEFVVLPGEDGNEMSAPHNIRKIVYPYITHAGSTYGLDINKVQYPADCIQVLRSRPFHFSARSCNKWSMGRVVLCGDAAHVFPPFGGQGIASGFRDAVSLAWRLVLATRPAPSTGYKHDYLKLFEGWYSERKQQLDKSLASTIENGSYVRQTDPFKIFVRDWGLWAIQLLPSWKRWLEQGNRRDGMVKYQWQPGKGMAFLPHLGGGGNFAQVYCADLGVRDQRPVIRFTDDVIFSSSKQGLFQLVAFLATAGDVPRLRTLLSGLDEASRGLLRADETTFFLNSTTPPSERFLEQHNTPIYRLATGEEFGETILCDSRPKPQFYDPCRMSEEVGGKRFAILRPDCFVFAANPPLGLPPRNLQSGHRQMPMWIWNPTPGLPSLAACEVNCWDNEFDLSARRSSDYQHHLMRNDATMLDIARSAIRTEASITKACKAQIDTAHCIWATYVTLRGESYLSSLSNGPDGILLYDPIVKPAADIIYFARGPLGVQNILFAFSADEVELETVRWNWWQDMPFSAGQSIYFDFDGLKIRNMHGNQEGNPKRPMWSAPSLRPSLVHFRLVQHSQAARFNRIMVNHREITGYSIAWNAARRALTMVAHAPSSDLHCYDEFPERGTTWFYIALGSGEFLKDIWRRDCHSHPHRGVDLIIATSLDNVYVVGPHENPNRRYSYSRLAVLRDGPNYMYIDDSVGFIRELAFDPEPGSNSNTWEDYRPVPISPNPGNNPNCWNISESFFYTSAPLDDLLGVNLCQFNDMVTVSRTSHQCPYVNGLKIFTDNMVKPPFNHGLDLERIFQLLEQTECRYIAKCLFRGTDVLFLECLPHGSLRDRISIISEVPRPVLQWMLQLSSAVACIENLGYAHGDINPQNVLVDDNDQLKLIDFDHALPIGDPVDVGYEPYVRQYRAGANDKGGAFGVAGPTTEQYALGSLFWYMSRGTELYSELEGPDQVERLMDDIFPVVNLEDPIDKIIDSCWHGRYNRVADLLGEIEGITGSTTKEQELVNGDEEVEKRRVCEEYYNSVTRP
ncbi:hypothetical protein MHUMG1_09751 [Metarhizium humberi]|uniref:Protein kinase domain-containing protein n=1 Tax=Metarhizium humberi TaxID=2596975 RepID=A0A9P8M5I6_9HYPO|nr:hypothetical protein MHUMG1_09751 [Metarhizium humberi]